MMIFFYLRKSVSVLERMGYEMDRNDTMKKGCDTCSFIWQRSDKARSRGPCWEMEGPM